MKVTFKPIKKDTEKQWDEFVESSPQGTIYHTSKWLNLIGSVPYYSPKIYALFNGDEIIAGIVFVEKKKIGFHIATMPLFTSYGGIILNKELTYNPGKYDQTISFIFKGINEKYSELSFVMQPALPITTKYFDEGFSIIPRMTYYLDFSDEEKLWNNMEGSLRRQIKKAERCEYIMNNECTSLELLTIIEKTFSKKNAEIEIPSHLFNNILFEKSLKNNLQTFCARDKESGKLTAVIIYLYDSKRCYYSIAGTDPEYLNTGVQPWLIWKSLAEMRGKNISVLDFVGGNIATIAKFKENFNPEKIDYFMITKFNSELLKSLKIMFRKTIV